MAAVGSPKKLQRYIHNQLLSPPSPSRPPLTLSRINLLPTHQALPLIITQCQPHYVHITALDCSFCILDKASISTLCNGLVNLESLKIVDCGVKELDFDTAWPKNLRSVDFSRNQLTECPQGIALLIYLRILNLSGNLIRELDPSLLKLSLLEKLYLLQNPLQNVPKYICREGVAKMREYFKTDVLPLPPQQDLDAAAINRNIQPISRKLSNSHTERRLDLRRYLLHQQGSFDSGYESSNRCRSTSGSSIDYMSESDNTCTVVDSVQWPSFDNYRLPEGYAPVAETTQCRVYLPGDCKDDVTVELVKDLSLYPTVQPNELLITPVVHIAPHGRKFSTEAPAVVVLPHCSKPSSCNGTRYDTTTQELIPVYSDSGLNQPPVWGKLDGECDCEVFDDCVLFKTTHFSLFAVVSVLPYPTASISIGPNHGGVLTVPELPGFEVSLPPTLGDTITITATIYYDDAPYNIESNERALASPCVALEPHGTQFNSPVQVSLPIPNYAEILSHFPDAKLELWHATPGIGMESLEPENWKPFQNADNISITQRGDGHVLIFTTGHFSWWETLWDIGRRALQKIGLGANVSNPTRTRYISVRIQAFMSQPIGLRMGGVADIQTFGLLVAVYKFGTPLSHLSNYPWSLLDTGSKRVYVQLGPLEVSIQGCFSALEYEDPSSPLTRMTELIEFDGDDFCQRFEFALSLEAGCEIQEGMLMGKLRFRQWKGTTPVNQNYNLMAKLGGAETDQSSPPPQQISPLQLRQPPILFNNPDFTPPWSPESDATHNSDYDEPFPCEPLTSATTPFTINNTRDTAPPQAVAPPRKRQLNQAFTHLSLGNGSSSGSCNSPVRPKRRRFYRTGDIDERTLLRIADSVGSKYTELGIQLGLDYKWIQSNVENKPSMNKDHLKALCILHEWRSRSGEEFGFAELAKALEAKEVGLNSVAMEMCYDTNS